MSLTAKHGILNLLNKDVLVKIFSLAIVGWAMLLLRYGYFFGDGDHAEILPVLLKQHHPQLYPNDFYLNALHSIRPDIRWFFVRFTGLFGPNYSLTFFIFHSICTIFLLAGTLFAGHVLKIKLIAAFTGLMACLLLLSQHIPGANFLYVPQLLPENFAFAFGIWSWWLMMRKKQFLACLLLVLATLFQPLAGLQFALVAFTALMLTRQINLKAALLYAATGGVFFIITALAYQTNQGSSDFFQLFVAFRHPHHYLPFADGAGNWLFALFLGIMAYQSGEVFIKKALLVIGLGLVLYIPMVSIFHLTLVAQTQWLKLLAPVYALGSMATASFLSAKLKLKLPAINPAFYYTSATVAAVVVGCLYVKPQLNPLNKPFETGNHPKYMHADLIDICTQISKSTPQDALFIVPFDASAFHYYSRRSAFVGVKTLVHSPDFMPKWYQRIKEVYGVDKTKPLFKQVNLANTIYASNIETAHIPKTVNYILVKTGSYPLPVVLRNNSYMVLTNKLNQ